MWAIRQVPDWARRRCTISREFSQNGYIDGLPRLERSAVPLSSYVFPADAGGQPFGSLIRGVAEGYLGVEGNDIPYTARDGPDGTEVYSTSIGGPKDHEVQAGDLNIARTMIDKRMVGARIAGAGLTTLGFTWRERLFQLQDVWEPSRRR